MAVYPEALVDLDEERGGVIMHLSPPAVQKQVTRRLFA
jgi:hypothetical protein